MPGRHRRPHTQPLGLILGGTLGALIRYAVSTTWPSPHQLLVSTVVTAGLAFLVAGFLLSRGPTSMVHFVVLGGCASVASLSAYAVLTINQPMQLSLAFLTLTPAAAAAGLLCGLLAARVSAR